MNFTERTLGGGVVIAGLAWLVFSYAQPQQAPPGMAFVSARTACRVLTVYDGDTVGCDLNGDGQIARPDEEIRLLGIDSPEMHYSRKNETWGSAHPVDEPFAREASRWMEKSVLKRTVYLEFDQKRQDRYNRTLAYVFLSPKASGSLNEQLLARGYARVLFLGNNRRYEPRFNTVEAQASQAKHGLWRR